MIELQRAQTELRARLVAELGGEELAKQDSLWYFGEALHDLYYTVERELAGRPPEVMVAAIRVQAALAVKSVLGDDDPSS